MNHLDTIFAAPAILSFALLLWQWIAARKFPLHQRSADPAFVPEISILKPLKGCDGTTAVSLESWLKQHYTGHVQILFGVADPEDPVCLIVEALLEKYPHRDAHLIICPETYGTNAKVSTLVQLEKLAKHDLVLVSDADVRVPADFLANAVAPLRDRKVGLVNCFYRLANPENAPMAWEAVSVNADFWSQVLQSQMLKPLDFALGAVMLTRRQCLAEIGGFKSLANCLADDYQLGHRIAAKKYRIVLSTAVVECWDGPTNWGAAWKHQLRWARTIRVCQPLPYFFSILSNVTFWALLWLVCELSKTTVHVFSSPASRMTGWTDLLNAEAVAAGIICVLRVLIACDLQHRISRSFAWATYFWLIPVKDLLQAAVWLGAFTGSTIEWRGQRMRLNRDGTLAEP